MLPVAYTASVDGGRGHVMVLGEEGTFVLFSYCFCYIYLILSYHH